MDPHEQRRTEELVRDFVTGQGFEIVKLRVTPQRQVLLTVDLDPGPLHMDHVARLNRGIRAAIEAAGLPVDDYAVEVESPGVRRALETRRHFERFVGQRIRAQVRPGAETDPKVYLGELTAVGEDGISIRLEKDELVQVAWTALRGARLDPQF